MELTSACMYRWVENEPRVPPPKGVGISDFAEPQCSKEGDPAILRRWWAGFASAKKLPLRPPVICGCPGAAM
jgi:hypothetical protein